MKDSPARRIRAWGLGALVTVAILIAVGYLYATWPVANSTFQVHMPAAVPEATAEQVHSACGTCHAYPPPETLPRSAWRREVRQGYDFLRLDTKLRGVIPPLEAVVQYYERRAPEALTLSRNESNEPSPVRFDRRGVAPADRQPEIGITHVSFVRLGNPLRPQVLVCDALAQKVGLLTISAAEPSWRELASGLACARAYVVDLDRDGREDILLACLGSFLATDDRVGSVVWLRGAADGSFEPAALLEGVGRVADVQAADFTGDGRLDLIVAVFGWRQTGEIRLLENRTTEWSRPTFVSHIVDDRHGTTRVPVADLNADGRPDFVALITQEHESVVAFLNRDGGSFEKRVIYSASHPTFGTSGLALADLDGDSDLDAILTNGDALDAPYLLKPYHGVQWLENRGSLTFEPHALTLMCGACGAEVADLDADGDQDLVVTSFLPAAWFPQRAALRLDSLVWLEQTTPGQFTRHSLETNACDHPSCAIGDIDLDGHLDVIVGNFFIGPQADDAVTIWSNAGPSRAAPR